MRAWTRAAIEERCGSCRRPIAIDQPMLILTIPAIRRGLKRCQDCAGQPVPVDLPARDVRTPVAAAAREPVQSMAHAVPLDWKRVAGGDREPGDEP